KACYSNQGNTRNQAPRLRTRNSISHSNDTFFYLVSQTQAGCQSISLHDNKETSHETFQNAKACYSNQGHTRNQAPRLRTRNSISHSINTFFYLVSQTQAGCQSISLHDNKETSHETFQNAKACESNQGDTRNQAPRLRTRNSISHSND